MSTLPFVTVDVFTTTRYTGNPLAIVRIPSEQKDVITTEHMQLMAREFNLSETVFIYEPTSTQQQSPEIPEWRIRIFFPDHELPFAGHPIIGTAVYALSTLAKGAKKGRLICNAGPVDVDFHSHQKLARASIPHNFHRHVEVPFTPAQVYGLQPSLKESPEPLKSEHIDVLSPVKGMNFVCVELPELESLAQVKVTGIKPWPTLDKDWHAGFAGSYYYVLQDMGDGKARPTTIRTRMLETSLEDPATGSAACALSCFLALKLKLGRQTDINITQGVEMGRRSDIRVQVVLDDTLQKIEKVYLVGCAVLVMEGNVFP